MKAQVTPDNEARLFQRVEGVFYRTIDPKYRVQAIAGSRLAGRYSSPKQPTLYLSASREGMAATIAVHTSNRSSEQEVIEVEVDGRRIFDLRNGAACQAIGIEPRDAAAPWQTLVADGARPKSWGVRERVIELGGKGLIDPSRQCAGLWHLVLFEWNKDGARHVGVVT